MTPEARASDSRLRFWLVTIFAAATGTLCVAWGAHTEAFAQTTRETQIRVLERVARLEECLASFKPQLDRIENKLDSHLGGPRP